MPGIATFAGPWVLEGLELESRLRQAHRTTIREQVLPIGRHQMGHRFALPAMAVQPEPTIHGVDHSVTPAIEFLVHRGNRVAHARPS